MSKVTLQFHATRSDIYSMVARWSDEARLTIVGETFFPEYRVRVLAAADLADGEEEVLGDVNRVSLLRGAVDLQVVSAMEFVRKNPNGFIVDVPRVDDGKLRESILGGTTDDAELMRLWRNLKNRAKRSMHKGAWIVNDATGAQARATGHSYSSAAKELQDAGVVMVAYAGWVRYELD